MSFVQVAYRTRVLEWVVLTAASRTDNAAIVLFAAILHPVPGELVRCLDHPPMRRRPRSPAPARSPDHGAADRRIGPAGLLERAHVVRETPSG